MSAQFAINRVWLNAAPQLSPTVGVPPGWTLANVMDRVLAGTHLTAKQVTWIGVDLKATNTGGQGLEVSCAGRSGPLCFNLVLYGTESDRIDTIATSLAAAGFYFGVFGCSFPWSTLGLPQGTSASGCVAIPVPVGVTVKSVGFDLTYDSPAAEHHVALWQA